MQNIKPNLVFGLLIIILCAFVLNVESADANPNANIEAIVRASFPDMPGMYEIAKCESGFRQFNADGTPLRGGGRYIGIFQIDEQLHRQRALDRAYDINTVEGNIAYARYMYFHSGTNPWKGCLPAPVPSPTPNPTPAPATPVSGNITITLKVGMNHSQVQTLQQLLNKKGFTVSATGPGSIGNETTFFGSLTKEAVKKFQCSKNITCSGDENTTGYGLVGPRTRASLME